MTLPGRRALAPRNQGHQSKSAKLRTPIKFKGVCASKGDRGHRLIDGCPQLPLGWCSVEIRHLRPLIYSSSRQIVSIAEVVEKGIDQWMTNRRAACVWFQVALGHVGFMCCVVHQHPIPRLVFRWP